MATNEDIPIEVSASNTSGDVDPQEKVSKDLDTRKLFEEIDKLDMTTLPENLQALNLEEVKRSYGQAKSISILVTGKTGSGKSTLVNGIVGFDVKGGSAAQVSSDPNRCTTEVKKYETNKGKIHVTVWDSPGFQDGTGDQEEYLEQMKRECGERDLTIYCTRISDIRFVHGDDNPDVVAMKKLTKAFGKEFWKTTIVVLTFANTLESFNLHWEEISAAEKAQEFAAKIQQWKDKIQKVLIQDVMIPEDIAKGVQVIPGSHYKKPHLPGYQYWMSVLWFNCLLTIPTPERKAALIQINCDRLKDEKDVTSDDLKKPLYQQPIVFTREVFLKVGKFFEANFRKARERVMKIIDYFRKKKTE